MELPAFEPTKAFSANFDALLGGNGYMAIARHMGGGDSRAWQAQIDELRKAFDTMDKYDQEQVGMWQARVLKAAGRLTR